MHNSRLFKVAALWAGTIALLILVIFSLQVQGARSQAADDSTLEIDRASAAEQATERTRNPQGNPNFMSGGGYELFAAVDGPNGPALLVDPPTGLTQLAFNGIDVWGAAYDYDNNRVFFSSGGELWEWPVGGTPSSFGTVTDSTATTVVMEGLGYYDGTLYASKVGSSGEGEGIYEVDWNTQTASIVIPFAVPANTIISGIDVDPATGIIYGVNDASAQRGLVQINLDGTVTVITDYVTGETDVDGLAVGDGRAYLITDDATPPWFEVWDLASGQYVMTVTNPFTTTEVFAAGAWVGDFVPPPPAPNINVDPDSLANTQFPDEVITMPLTIENVGTLQLDWDIVEEAALPAGPWSDNFDSYANDSQIHGQGGWKGWFNDPTFGAFVRDDQARSAPHSLEIMGASDPVHEFSGYTSGQWTFTTWQYIPSTLVGDPFFIMLNTYNDDGIGLNWSVTVQYLTATDTVFNTGISGGTLPIIYDEWVEIRVEIDLDNDTQDFYYGGQLLYSGTWTNEVSGGGALNIGVVDLYANSSSPVYYDDLSLVPAGGSGGCSPGDIPWASADPTSGSTPAGDSDVVDVTLDSTGLTPGVYTGDLCIESNDPDEPAVTVPVELTVDEPPTTPDIELNPTSFAVTVTVDTQDTEVLDISNVGTADLNWTIEEQPAAAAPASPVAVNPAAEPQVESAADCAQFANYAGREPAGYAEFCAAPVSAEPAGDPLFDPTDTAYALNHTVDTIVSHELGDFPNQTVMTPAIVCNPGDIPWVSVDPAAGTTAPGATTSVDVTFDATGLATGVYTGTLCVNSDDPVDPLLFVPITMTVVEEPPPPPVPQILLVKTVGTDPAECADVDVINVPAGTEVTYCYEVTNTGTVTATTHDLTDSELGDLLTGYAYDLAPGASYSITATAVITEDTTNTAIWTAHAGDQQATAQDSATVMVLEEGPDENLMFLPLTYNGGAGEQPVSENTAKPAGFLSLLLSLPFFGLVMRRKA